MFVSVEGIEGSGKSTLLSRLKTNYPDAVFTKEPGATPLGQQIREVIFDNHPSELAEVLLFLADRAEHVDKVLLPALEKGQMVFCDRYMDSTFAYQGYGRGKDLKLLMELNKTASKGLVPDCTLLLDLPAEVGLQRAMTRSESEWTRFEAEELSFHEKIRSGFLELAKGERFAALDATKTEEDLFQDALAAINDRQASLSS